jgi:predicted acyltransferase
LTRETSRPGRRRALSIVVNVLLVPAWVLVAFISINSFEDYTEVGNLTLLALIMFFALWAWWYGEDRDRRQAAKARRVRAEDGQDAAGDDVG